MRNTTGSELFKLQSMVAVSTKRRATLTAWMLTQFSRHALAADTEDEAVIHNAGVIVLAGVVDTGGACQM